MKGYAVLQVDEDGELMPIAITIEGKRSTALIATTYRKERGKVVPVVITYKIEK